MRVLIAPDKFKGTLSAPEAAAAIARGWHRVRPSDTLLEAPISDGGDGFGALLGHHLGAETRTTSTVDAAGRPLATRWWWLPSDRLAIIESATVIGLALLPPGRYHPFNLDSFGLGQVLREAAALRPRCCLVGIGGSATNDAGFGLARSLGWRFLDRNGEQITRWPDLAGLAAIRSPRTLPRLGELVVAVDVRNPLLGAKGATRIYGPQKGIRPEDVAPAEQAFRRLTRRLRQLEGLTLPTSASRLPGAGAAGGLGFGLMAFAGARLEPGFQIFTRYTRLAGVVATADLVLTGEGALDLTSVAMGKGVGQLALLSRRARVPCVALAGTVAADPAVQRRFTATRAIVPGLAAPEEARRHAGRWLTRLAADTARAWPHDRLPQPASG